MYTAEQDETGYWALKRDGYIVARIFVDGERLAKRMAEALNTMDEIDTLAALLL